MNDQTHSLLLSHIVSRWSNRTEDIAVDALGFVLSRSRAARTALKGVLETSIHDIGELTHAKTQVTGSDGARPDLASSAATARNAFSSKQSYGPV